MTSDDDPVQYRKRERLADRWRGRRDGRRRHPAYRDLVEMTASDGMISAPYPERLIWRAVCRMETEYLAYEQRTANNRASLARLREDLDAAGVGLDRTSLAVEAAEAPLTDDELRPRNHAELLPENQVVLLSRRDAMRNRRIVEARGGEAAQLAALNDINGRIASVKENIKEEFVLAQTRARLAGGHCAVRVAAYWESLVLVHPEGPHLAALLRFTAQVLPSWVTASPDRDPADLGRGPFELHRVAQRIDPSARRGMDITGDPEEPVDVIDIEEVEDIA